MNSWLRPTVQPIYYCMEFLQWLNNNHRDGSDTLGTCTSKTFPWLLQKMYLFYQKNMCQGQVAPGQVSIRIIWNLFFEVTSLVNPQCCSGNGLRANRVKELIKSYTCIWQGWCCQSNIWISCLMSGGTGITLNSDESLSGKDTLLSTQLILFSNSI